MKASVVLSIVALLLLAATEPLTAEAERQSTGEAGTHFKPFVWPSQPLGRLPLSSRLTTSSILPSSESTATTTWQTPGIPVGPPTAICIHPGPMGRSRAWTGPRESSNSGYGAAGRPA